MNVQSLAQRAYSTNSAPTRSARSMEYEIIARVTYRLKAAAQKGRLGFSQLAQALHENQELWIALAADVSDADNGLPDDLRARVFYLAEFTRAHTKRVLDGADSVAPLLEVNTAILKGLRQGALVK